MSADSEMRGSALEGRVGLAISAQVGGDGEPCCLKGSEDLDGLELALVVLVDIDVGLRLGLSADPDVVGLALGNLVEVDSGMRLRVPVEPDMVVLVMRFVGDLDIIELELTFPIDLATGRLVLGILVGTGTVLLNLRVSEELGVEGLALGVLEGVDIVGSGLAD